MKAQAITDNFLQAKAETLAAAVFKNEKATDGILKQLDDASGGIISSIIKSEEFKGESGETALVYVQPNGNIKASRILLVGAGKKEDYDCAAAAEISGTAARFLSKRNIKSFAIAPRCEMADAADSVAAAIQGALFSSFELDKYRTQDKNGKKIDSITVYVENGKSSDIKAAVERGQIIGDSINLTRDLANEPPNILTPTEMANRAKQAAKEANLKFDVLDEAKMEKMGMNSLLSVSRGSTQPAKLIVLKYEPKKNTGKKGDLLALVGKGITFDTGGISLKPGEHMDAMKYDMSGGATVIGAMRAIGMLKAVRAGHRRGRGG